MGKTIDIDTQSLNPFVGKLNAQKDNLAKHNKIDFQMKGRGLSVSKIKQFENLYSQLVGAITELYSRTIEYMDKLAQDATDTDEAIASSFRNGE